MKYFLVLALALFTLPALSQRADTLSNDEQLAARLMSNGEYDKAVVLYEELYKKTPTILVYNNYLRCLLELKEFRKAERLVKQQIKDNPGRIRFEVDLGYLYTMENDTRKARRQLEGLISNVAMTPTAIADLAGAFLFREMDDYALQTYLKGRQGTAVPFHIPVAEIYERKEDYPNMMAEYVELAIADPTAFDQVQGILQDAVNNDPTMMKSEALRRVLLQGSQRNSQQSLYSELLLWLSVQLKDFETALRQARIIDRRLQQDGRIVLDLANLSASNQNYDIARQGYEYILSLGDLSPYFMDATVGLLNARYQEAVSGFEINYSILGEVEAQYAKTIDELGLNATTVSLIRNLAHLKAFYLGKTDEASQILNQVIALPNVSGRIKAECRIELADILLLKGDLWDAHLLYAQVDKAFRDDPLAHEARYKNARLSFYMGEFKWSRAQLDVLKAATSRLISNDAMALSMFIQDNLGQDSISEPLQMFARAQMHTFMNLNEKAMQVYDSIATRFPSHKILDNVMMARAQLMIKTGQYPQADQLLAEVTQKYPEGLLAADALFLRARLHETMLDDTEQAMELYQTLIMDYPGSLNTVTARNRYRYLRGDKTADEEYFYNHIFTP